jgi:hypothetical protein
MGEVAYFDEFFKDGRKVFVRAVVEGVEGFGALKRPKVVSLLLRVYCLARCVGVSR